MAINKKLIHFGKKENFDIEVANNNINDYSIVFIKDSKQLSTHNTVYNTVNWGMLKSEALAGDYCLYDKNADKLTIVSSSEDLTNYPSSNYSPVGVVVVPGSHDVYGTGECGVMSLMEMDYSTPDTGAASHQYMYWGYDSLDISSLDNMNVVPSLGTMSEGTPSDTLQGTTNYGYIPMDSGSYKTQSGASCPHDTNATYYSSTSSSHCFIPSPYLTDGSRNPDYYQTSSPSSTANALSGFDGVSNTQIITDLATGQSDWKTADTITNSYSSGYYPAACCCWRFHTDGTTQGQWYLPACGEIGYMISRFNAICASIAALIDAYGNSVGVQLSSSNLYWSSTEYSSRGARYVGASIGGVDYYYKNYGYCVRAWLRVNP